MLQFLAAGIDVSLSACPAEVCQQRAAELVRTAERILRELRPHETSEVLSMPACSLRAPRVAVTPPHELTLREPDATRAAITALRAPSGTEPLPASERGEGSFESAVGTTPLVRIDAAACSSCGSCTRSCPTGALAERESDVDYRIVFDRGRCTACGQCVTTCPEGAVSARRVIDVGSRASRVETLVRRPPPSRCERCGSPLFAGVSEEVIARRLRGGGDLARRLGGTTCADCSLTEAVGSHPVNWSAAGTR